MRDDPLGFWGPPGDSVPAVDPSDLKAAWGIYQDLKESNPQGRVAVSTSVIEHACSPGADIRAVTYRSGMLGLLLIVPGELLGPWQQGEQLSEVVFKVVARIPMEWLETGAPRQGFPFDVDAFLQELRDGTSAANQANASSSLLALT
jgi:hypothetical protein